jgi:hypothetical protein
MARDQYEIGYEAARRHAVEICLKFAANYPKDVFPDPEQGCSPDRYAAAMARHVCAQLARMIMEDE